MKRIWPLAFLTLLFGALVLRPAPKELRPMAHRPGILPEPVAIVEAPPPVPAPPPPDEPAPPAPEERPEVYLKRSAVGATILWLATHQNEDGSWGDVPVTVGGRTIGRTGVTSLAIQTLLGAGYSQLSKDEYDGTKTFGEVVKKALKWYVQDQREDGTFRSAYDAGFDQVLGTLAITEAYGMTASQVLKEPAEKAIEAMLRMQGSDGSWGGPEPTAWAAQALFSAQLGELPVPGEAQAQTLQYVERTSHPGNVLSRMLLTRKKESAAAEAEALASSLPNGDRDFGELFHATTGLFGYDGPDGPLWKRWNESIKKVLVSSQQRDGSWLGGTMSHIVVRTSLAGLTLEVYYRYSNPTGIAK